MKKPKLLTPAHAAWLDATIQRNRDRYAGFSMMADDGGDGGGDGGGDAGNGGDGKGGDGGGGKGGDGDSGGSGKGYPDNTRVEDMKSDEQAAYWRDQARKHEGRNRDLLKVTGGKYGDDLKAIIDEREALLNEKRTDGEKAVEEAKQQTRSEVRQEFGAKLAAAEFRAALAHVDDERRRDQIIEGINLSAYLTDDGDVDTDKVKSYAATIAPGKGKKDPDYGGGKRGDGDGSTGGVAAVMERRRKAREANKN